MEMMETYYRILKHDPEGKLVHNSGLVPSRSYVIQFLELIEGLFDGTSKTATDVDEAESWIVRGGEQAIRAGVVDAGAGADTHGIVVGTNAGTTAEGNENFKLDTKIEHSAVGAAGKLNYQAVTRVAPTVADGNVDLDISRTFLNETGSTITVKEIGIICREDTYTKYFLLLRDVVSDEDVLDGDTLTVIYTLRTTV